MKQARKKAPTVGKAGSKESEVRNGVNKEAILQRDKVMSDNAYAWQFFCVLMRDKVSGLIRQYSKTYKVNIDVDAFCTMLFRICWDKEWQRLRTFSGRTTLYDWVLNIASQNIYDWLVDEKYIKPSKGKDASDYRLTILSIRDEAVRQDIIDMVSQPDAHKLLTLEYVQKISKENMARIYGGADKYKAKLNKAETMLKTRLLNTENPYCEMAMSLKVKVYPEVEWDTCYDSVDDGDWNELFCEFRECLRDIYHNEDWDMNVESLVETILGQMGWSERQKDVWYERFMNKTPSLELAERWDVTVGWVDNAFMHLNRSFQNAVRMWWRQNQPDLRPTRRA